MDGVLVYLVDIKDFQWNTLENMVKKWKRVFEMID